MPFIPSPLEFHRGEQEKPVKFFDKAHGPAPWTVLSVQVQIYGAYVDQKRWSFLGVAEDPTSPGYMIGTLHFDDTNFPNETPEDLLLDYVWQFGTDDMRILDFNVSCDGQNRPMLLKVLL